jgi:hypothetical protein
MTEEAIDAEYARLTAAYPDIAASFDYTKPLDNPWQQFVQMLNESVPEEEAALRVRGGLDALPPGPTPPASEASVKPSSDGDERFLDREVTKAPETFVSKHGIGAPVWIEADGTKIAGHVRAVTFTSGKVRYAVSVLAWKSRTTLHNIDSIVVTERDGEPTKFPFDNYS